MIKYKAITFLTVFEIPFPKEIYKIMNFIEFDFFN
jgi:hypothetical protein